LHLDGSPRGQVPRGDAAERLRLSLEQIDRARRGSERVEDGVEPVLGQDGQVAGADESPEHLEQACTQVRSVLDVHAGSRPGLSLRSWSRGHSYTRCRARSPEREKVSTPRLPFAAGGEPSRGNL